jgi:hypothetical protein
MGVAPDGRNPHSNMQTDSRFSDGVRLVPAPAADQGGDSACEDLGSGVQGLPLEKRSGRTNHFELRPVWVREIGVISVWRRDTGGCSVPS